MVRQKSGGENAENMFGCGKCIYLIYLSIYLSIYLYMYISIYICIVKYGIYLNRFIEVTAYMKNYEMNSLLLISSDVLYNRIYLAKGLHYQSYIHIE